MSTIICPSCTHAIDVPEDRAEATLRCPACGKETFAPVTVPPPQTRAPQEGARTADSLPTLGPEASPVPAPAIPHGYQIEGEIGRGGMGVVYRARQVALGRAVALKMLLHAGHAGHDGLARFRTEAEALARLKHPGIVTIHEVGEMNGLPFFAMEWCEGGSLDRKLAGKPLPAREAASLVQRISRAVQAAHEAKVVHRDLKPANVLLSAGQAFQPDAGGAVRLESLSYDPKVSDFGLAKVLDERGRTRTGEVMGTPEYMPPEQAARKKEVGVPADVYALGAILYECLTGRPPFRAATATETLLQVLNEEPVAPRSLNAAVPRDLETVCLKCLAKDPAKRYASAAELADDLRRFLAGEPIRARRVGPAERLARWGRKNPQTAGLLATVGLLLIAGTVTAWLLAGWALAEKGRARSAAGEAEREAILAGQREQDAVREKKEAGRQRDRAELLVYAGKLALAQREWQDNNGPRAIELLGECQWNLRGWEHRHLWTLFHSSQVTLRGHAFPVTSVAFSPDGKRIASGSNDGTVKVWDAGKGQEVLSLKGHAGPVFSVAYSPDGKRIVSGSADKTVKVWDAEKGQELLSLRGYTSAVWRPDGNRIAADRNDGTVTIFDAQKGQAILPLLGQTGPVACVAYSPDGQRISGKDRSGKVLTWDARTGQLLPDARPVPMRQQTEATSPDGSQRAFIENGQIKVVRLPDFIEAQKHQQAQDRAFLQRLARPDPTYHRQKAELYEKSANASDLFAAAFHLRRLVLIEPKDAGVRKRLAAVESKLAAQATADAVLRKRPAKTPSTR